MPAHINLKVGKYHFNKRGTYPNINFNIGDVVLTTIGYKWCKIYENYNKTPFVKLKKNIKGFSSVGEKGGKINLRYYIEGSPTTNRLVFVFKRNRKW